MEAVGQRARCRDETGGLPERCPLFEKNQRIAGANRPVERVGEVPEFRPGGERQEAKASGDSRWIGEQAAHRILNKTE